jgi:hypothetical protein
VSDNKFLEKKLILSKIDLIILKMEEKSEKISKMKEKRSKAFKELSLKSLKTLELKANICMNYKRKPFHSELHIIFC